MPYRQFVTYQQKPTAHQIEVGQLIVPKPLWQQHQEELRGEFTAVAFGIKVPNRSLDQSRRVRVPLKGHLDAGDTVTLRVENGTLIIDRASQ